MGIHHFFVTATYGKYASLLENHAPCIRHFLTSLLLMEFQRFLKKHHLQCLSPLKAGIRLCRDARDDPTVCLAPRPFARLVFRRFSFAGTENVAWPGLTQRGFPENRRAARRAGAWSSWPPPISCRGQAPGSGAPAGIGFGKNLGPEVPGWYHEHRIPHVFYSDIYL